MAENSIKLGIIYPTITYYFEKPEIFVFKII